MLWGNFLIAFLPFKNIIGDAAAVGSFVSAQLGTEKCLPISCDFWLSYKLFKFCQTVLRLFEIAVEKSLKCLAVTSFVASHFHQSLRCARDCGGKALIYKAFHTFMIKDTYPKVNGNVCEPVSREHTGGQQEWHRHRI